MEDLAVITALNHSGSFGTNFVKFKEKKILFTSLGRSVLGKTVPPVLSASLGLRPWAVFKTSGAVFLDSGLPAGEENIYIVDSTLTTIHISDNGLDVRKKFGIF